MLKLEPQAYNQNVTISITYMRASDKSWWTFLVRNHPLTRTFIQNFTGAFNRLTNSVSQIEAYQFPGGLIKRQVQSDKFNSSIVNNIDWSTNYNENDQALAAAALELVKMEIGVSISDFLQTNGIRATLTKLNSFEESVVTHCWHLHLGKLNQEAIDNLSYSIKISRTLAEIFCLPLTAIRAHKRPDQTTVYTVVAAENIGKKWFPGDRRGLQTPMFDAGQWSQANALELQKRPVAIRADNAQRLFACAQMEPIPYLPSDVMALNECEIMVGDDNNSDFRRVLHIPTGTYYVVHFIQTNSTICAQLAKQFQQPASQVATAVAAFAQAQVLVAKLYAAHGIATIPLKLANAGAGWWLVAQEQQPRRNAYLKQLSKENQAQFVRGLGCDIAFSNSAIFSNMTGPIPVCVNEPNKILQRLDMSSCLNYQATGVPKNQVDWQSPISEALFQMLSPELFELSLDDWQLAKQTLASVTDEQRLAIVLEHGYGEEDTRRSLGHQINARVAQTMTLLETCINTHVTLPTHRVQNVAIAVTFKQQENGQDFVLFVRDNPLTRAAIDNFVRPVARLLESNVSVKEYQFPGGAIDPLEDLQVPWIENKFKTNVEQRIAKASLRELWEESGLKLDTNSLNELGLNPSNFTFRKIDSVHYDDLEKNTAATVHYLHLDLGQLSNAQKKRLYQFQDRELFNPNNTNTAVGWDVVAMGWVRIETIQVAYTANRKSGYSMILNDSIASEEKGGHVITTPDARGLEKGLKEYHGTEAYLLKCHNLPVGLNRENALRLEQLGFNLGQLPYVWPDIMTTREFKIDRNGNNNDRHERWGALHIPTGASYSLKFPLSKGLIVANAPKVATQLGLTTDEVLERFYRNDYLTAKLYELFGINVLPTHLVRREDGKIGVGYQEPPHLNRVTLDEMGSQIPDRLSDGVGCDIVLANFGAISYGPETHLGLDNQRTCFRLDYSGGLAFRGRGLVKDPRDWGTEINLKQVTEHPDHPGWRALCKKLDDRKWQRALTTLMKVSSAQIEATVSMHGYGTSEERYAFAVKINQRLVNTILAIKHYLKLPIEPVLQTHNIVNLLPVQDALNFCIPPLQGWLKTEQLFGQQLVSALQLFQDHTNTTDSVWLRQEVIPPLSAIGIYWENAFGESLLKQFESLLNTKNLTHYGATVNQLHDLFRGEAFSRFFMKLVSYSAIYKKLTSQLAKTDFAALSPSANVVALAKLKTTYSINLALPLARLRGYADIFIQTYKSTPDTADFVICKNQLKAILDRLVFLNQQANRIQAVTDPLTTSTNLELSDIEEMIQRWQAAEANHPSLLKEVVAVPKIEITEQNEPTNTLVEDPTTVVPTTMTPPQSPTLSGNTSKTQQPPVPAARPTGNRPRPAGVLTPSGYKVWEEKFKNVESDSDSEEDTQEYEDEYTTSFSNY